MPFDFNWHDSERTIVRVDIHGSNQWGDYHTLIDKVIEALKQTTQRIDVIFNDTSAGLPPGNPMPHIKATSEKLVAYPNMGMIVVANGRNTSRIVKLLVPMVYRAYGIDTRIIGDFVATLADAESAITRERAKAAISS